VLLVSHDRALLDAVAQRTAAIEDGTVRVYDGGWADLVRAREEREEPKPEPEREPKARKPAAAAPPKPGPDPLAAIEAEVEQAEAGW
jgi:ATPase subunit of ABC transporter with duplicated ATPase domains